MIREIVEYPDEILTTPTEAVTGIELHSSHIQTLIEDMIDTCIAEDGLGLAANQVGVNKRIFISRRPLSRQFDVFINPVITKKKGKVTHHGEACLSIPGKYFEVNRFKSVVIESLDRNGEGQLTKSKSKRQAFCFQHEIDHLDGLTLQETSK